MKNVKANTGLTPADEGIIAAFLDNHAAKAIEHLKAVQQAEVRDGMKWTEDEAYEAAFDYLAEQWMQDPGMPDPGESTGADDWDESAEIFDGAVQEVLKRFKAEGGLFETMQFQPAHRAIRYAARLKAKLASRVKASLALKSDNDLIGDIIAYESGDLDEAATIALFQKLVDSGMAWSLQGHYGRTAKDMIEQGLITVKASAIKAGKVKARSIQSFGKLRRNTGELTGSTWIVDVANPEGDPEGNQIWGLANADKIPYEMRQEGQIIPIEYDADDQFVYYDTSRIRASSKIKAEDMTSEEGVCPVCESQDMDLGNIKLDDEGMYARRSFFCNNCESKGNEAFKVEYETTEVDKKGTRPGDDIEGSRRARLKAAGPYKSLNDAATAYPELSGLAPGSTRILYHRNPTFSTKDVKLDSISDTHVELGSIASTDLEEIFSMLQGDVWSPEGEARDLISSKGLRHTSMSVGDVLEIDGKLMIVANSGFKTLASKDTFTSFQASLKARTGLKASEAGIADESQFKAQVATRGVEFWISAFIKRNGLNDLAPVKAAMQLLPKEILALIPPMDSTSDKEAKDVKVPLKLFNPGGAGSWFITEMNPATGEAFGYVTGLGGDELGYIDINELKSYRGPMGLGIERDSSWNPSTTLDQVMSGVSASKKAKGISR